MLIIALFQLLVIQYNAIIASHICAENERMRISL